MFCWAFAKRMGGRFMIRIEDTDQARSSEESAKGILEDLAWLGIEWDDGPRLVVREGGAERVIGAGARDVGSYFQAQRRVLYDRYLTQLVEQGKAYPAFEKSDELEAKRKAAVAAKQTYRYDRASYNAVPTPAARLAKMREFDAAGMPYVIRFFAPHEEVVVHDQVLGDVKYAAGEMDDFVIRKADGFPTYHFAVVVDDETMGVTHVMRAQEHLNNTPRHVALQKALGFRTPVYAHMPLIFNMDGTKMSKRDKAKAARKAVKDAMAKDKALAVGAVAKAAGVDEKLLGEFVGGDNDNLDVAQAIGKHFGVTLPEIEVWDYRQSGYLPEAITNFIALLGWNPGMKLPDGKDLEKFDMKFLAEHFSIERIGKTNAKFDRAKLLSFNADAIAALSDEEFARRWKAYLGEYDAGMLAKLEALGPRALGILATTAKPRARTFRDAVNSCRFALLGDEEFGFDQKAMEKIRRSDEKNGAGQAGARSGLDLLVLTKERLGGISDSDWTPGTISTVLEQLAQQLGVGIGQVAQPLRVAVTGTGVSPGIGETLGVLGKIRTMRRIDRCLAEAGAPV